MWTSPSGLTQRQVHLLFYVSYMVMIRFCSTSLLIKQQKAELRGSSGWTVWGQKSGRWDHVGLDMCRGKRRISGEPCQRSQKEWKIWKIFRDWARKHGAHLKHLNDGRYAPEEYRGTQTLLSWQGLELRRLEFLMDEPLRLLLNPCLYLHLCLYLQNIKSEYWRSFGVYPVFYDRVRSLMIWMRPIAVVDPLNGPI